MCTCSPIFPFDYLFGSSQSTTPESVISDYRHQKRTDSSFDHNNLVKNATENVSQEEEQQQQQSLPFKESNAEFYAEVIGKLVGSVRSSFTNLFDDIRKRNSHFREKSKIDAHSKATDELNKSLNVIVSHLAMTNNLTNEPEEMTNRITKRYDRFFDDKVGEIDVIPINLNQFDNDLLSNEDYTAELNENEQPSSEDESWLARYYQFFEQIKTRHHNRRDRKIQRFLKIVLTPILLLNETDENSLNFDSELTFNIIQNNHTIAQLTPFEMLRILQRESNDKITNRMKIIMKRIFYKYTRLYLIARRNFKSSHGNYRNVRNVGENNIAENIEFSNENEISGEEEEDDDDDDFDVEVTTNDGRTKFQSVEAFAIMMLEIFGAVFALSIGLWAQLQGGFLFDLLD